MFVMGCKYSKSCRISERKRVLPVGVIVEDCVKEIALGLTLKNELEFQQERLKCILECWGAGSGVGEGYQADRITEDMKDKIQTYSIIGSKLVETWEWEELCRE